MKRTFLMLACTMLLAGSAFGQAALVKDLAKKAGSSNVEDLLSVIQQIEPAFTNPETANDVLTWYTAGKAAFGIYDNLLAAKTLGKPVDNEMMAQVLSTGFECMQHALPLDSIVEKEKDGTPKLDKNGNPKVKTKYSKEIVPLLTSHIGDIANVGNEALNAQKYEQAASAYSNFCDIASSPFAKANGVNLADSVMAEVRFYQGYSQYQIKQYANAYDSFGKAIALGYKGNSVGEYLTSSIANHVQGMLDAKDFAGANQFIDKALAARAGNATLLDLKGFAHEIETGIDAALPFYKQAAAADNNNANALYDCGRGLYMQACAIIEANPDKSTDELKPLVEPLCREALPYLEKAVSLDSNIGQAQRVIDDIKYKFEQMGIK